MWRNGSKYNKDEILIIIILTVIMTNEQQYLRFTYRKYLGTDCKTAKENVQLNNN
jgi:hypothetical protein